MRNAELKEFVTHTAAHNETEINVSAADYPDLGVNDGDTVTRVRWTFHGGGLDGKPVLETLRDYHKYVGIDIDTTVLRRLMCDSRPSRDVRPVKRALSAEGECIELLGLRHLTHALTIPNSVRSTNS